jgi:eukaryotic-like serine/threonine-protein kinase
MLRMAGVPAPLEQVIVKMAAKAPLDRYQTTDELINALTSALAASQLSMPSRWRPGMSSSMPQLDGSGSIKVGLGGNGAQGQTPSSPGQTPGYSNQQLPVVTLPCFRCGASNPSTRLFCTTCGYELSDKRAAADRFMGPNGRPVLARLTIQNGPMGGRSYLFHQDVTTIGRTNGNDLVISGRTVSRRHARLWFDNGRWYIEDLQSANGTLVNSVRVYQPITLNDGDVINFGDEIVVFNTTF